MGSSLISFSLTITGDISECFGTPVPNHRGYTGVIIIAVNDDEERCSILVLHPLLGSGTNKNKTCFTQQNCCKQFRLFCCRWQSIRGPSESIYNTSPESTCCNHGRQCTNMNILFERPIGCPVVQTFDIHCEYERFAY